MKIISTALFILMMTTGCAKQEVKSVDYFMANIAEAKTKLQWCKVSTERSITSDCISASSALANIKSQRLLGNSKLPISTSTLTATQ